MSEFINFNYITAAHEHTDYMREMVVRIEDIDHLTFNGSIYIIQLKVTVPEIMMISEIQYNEIKEILLRED